MVDLSKLKPGDTVHFRCGGKAEILSVRIKEPERSYKYGVILKNSANERIRYDVLDPVGFYQIGGTLKGTNVEDPLDIIRVEPAFRWEDVRPGMAFFDYERDILFYIGPDFEGGAVFSLGPSVNDDTTWFVNKEDLKDLTPAPEHNIEVAK